jgi:hypothetical protein
MVAAPGVVSANIPSEDGGGGGGGTTSNCINLAPPTVLQQMDMATAKVEVTVTNRCKAAIRDFSVNIEGTATCVDGLTGFFDQNVTVYRGTIAPGATVSGVVFARVYCLLNNTQIRPLSFLGDVFAWSGKGFAFRSSDRRRLGIVFR